MYSKGVNNDVFKTTICDLPSRRKWNADQEKVNGDEHCSSPIAKKGGFFTARKMELNDPIFNTENSNQAHESLNTLSGRRHFKQNINSCALLLLSGPEMYQRWNICIESHTMSIIRKLKMPTCYLENMLGIFRRSWIQFNNIFKRRYHQHNIKAGVLSHSITIIQGCPNRF